MRISKLLSFVFFLALIPQTFSTNFQFYGYTHSFYSEPTNWAWTGYPGTTINTGDYVRVSSNFSARRCSLDVDVINNGHVLLQENFYYNGHTLTNNDLLELDGTVWGDVTSEASGTLSAGWIAVSSRIIENVTINGSLTSNGKIMVDFDGDNNTHDSFQATTTATIAGTLEVSFFNNFTPALNSPYTIITSNGLSGTFSAVTWPAGYTGTVTYTASDEVQVSFFSLPVELFNFDAMSGNDQVDLKWQTASETNNSHFDIEHSVDGRQFQKIGSKVGMGTSTEFKEYLFTHNNPLDGLNYYRLKQVDFDGRSDYSKIISIEVYPDLKIKIYPNPVSNFVFLKFDKKLDRAANLKVTDLNGRIVLERKSAPDISQFNLDFTGLNSGIYFLEINKGGKWCREKIIKK
ncbi:MAG: T9SS type A sorting domain-containing protein [Bacteroidota bacterium]